jgi:dTMP kinase
MIKGVLISISGIDGTGKSTLIKNIINELKKEGIFFTYFYGGLNSRMIKYFVDFINKLFLKDVNILTDYVQYDIKKKKIISKYIFLSKIYQYILLFLYVIHININIVLSLKMRKNVICDRYAYDVVVSNLSVDMNLNNGDISTILKYLFKFIPKPKYSFLLDVDEIIAFNRKNDIPSLSYLVERRNSYLSLNKSFDLIILNGEQSVDKLTKMIKDQILNNEV